MQSKDFKDYYYILGIHKNAKPEQIEKAYSDMYQKYGPQVAITGQDPDMMLRTYSNICEAYEVLIDPEKRREYDKANDGKLQKSDLRALWVKYSGLESPKNAAPKITLPDTITEVSVTLREAIKGCKKIIELEEPKPCKDCFGLKPVLRLQCPNCRGLGYTSSDRKEELDLPAGLTDKAELRFEELGKYDLQTAKRATLIVLIRLERHQYFGVLDRDITCTLPVSIYEAILGTEIEVPTATGKVLMRIQSMTQSGRVYRLKGMGLAGADQLVTIEVVTPQKLSQEELELFHKLQQLSQIQTLVHLYMQNFNC